MKNSVIIHGECMIFRNSIPKNAKGIEPSNRTYMIVADSETTGNHHVVDTPEGVSFYELDGIRYMKNEVPTKVRCVQADRHDAIVLEPGSWEFGIQQEYDHITEEIRSVQD